MQNFVFLEKLNKIIQTNRKQNSSSYLNLCAGNLEETLLTALKEIAPFSRIAIVYTEKSTEDLLIKNMVLLKKAGYKVYDVVIKEQAVFSLDNLLDAVALPEDVRAIISFDYSLLTALKYVSTVKNLPAILVNLFNDLDNLLALSDFIKNGKMVNDFIYTYNLTVIFNDEYNAPIEADNFLLEILGNIDLVDYEINALLKGEKTNAVALSLIKTSSQTDNDSQRIFENALNYQVANFISSNKLNKSSAFNCALKAFALSNGKKPSLNQKVCILKAMFKIYEFGFSFFSSELLQITDYGNMINNACKRCKLNFSTVSSKFLTFLDDCVKNAKKMENLLPRILKTLEDSQCFDDFDKAFASPKSKSKKELATCIKDGVCINPYNGIGVLTEKGVINQIL